MGMTDRELDNLAEEMAAHSVAQQIARELTKNSIKARNMQKCPHCGSYGTRKHREIEEVFVCSKCSTFFGNDFQYVFPVWAQGKKRHFRKWLCLFLNIRGKEVVA